MQVLIWLVPSIMALFLFLLLAIVLRNKQYCSRMMGMMMGMAIGMLYGLTLGLLLGSYLQGNLMYNTVFSMLIGIVSGIILGFPFSILAVIEGILAGIMGGMMGAMLGEMISGTEAIQLIKILLTVTCAISFLFMLLCSQSKSSSDRVTFVWLLRPFLAIVLFSIFFVSLHHLTTFDNSNIQNCSHDPKKLRQNPHQH
jgi:hypothetical protein